MTQNDLDNGRLVCLVGVATLRPAEFVIIRIGQWTGHYPLSYADYVDYRDSNSVFSALASHYPTAPLSLASRDGSIEANGSVVSSNYFSVLGIKPAAGRFFLPQDVAGPGVSPVAVVSHRLWQSHFGGRRDIAGQVVELNGTSFTVVGVAPADFEGVLLGIPTDVWLPNSMSAVGYRWCDTLSRDCTWLNMIGRLKPGQSLASVQAEMTVLSRRLEQAHPDTNKGLGLVVVPLRGVHPSARQDTRQLASLLLAGVTLVVAVAGANASSLLLMRSLTRRKEIAMRLALGATRMRVVSAFVVEALLQALLGGAGWLCHVSASTSLAVRRSPATWISTARSTRITSCGRCGGREARRPRNRWFLPRCCPGSTKPGCPTSRKDATRASCAWWPAKTTGPGVRREGFPFQPAKDFSGLSWSRRPDLNRGPADYESAALPLSYVGVQSRAPGSGGVL
jgi:MacB-like protein